MTDYREILRLTSQGISQRSIAVSCGCSRNTVARVLRRVEQSALDWVSVSGMSNAEIQQRLYPELDQQMSLRSLPDCPHIHREMAKRGVTLPLLWEHMRSFQ